MKLTALKREGKLKSELSLLRHKGDIPAVLYSKGNGNTLLSINGEEFNSMMRHIEPGHLPTTEITLSGEGVDKKVIVKEVQYHKTTYKVVHLDFQELSEENPIIVKVPVHYSGVAECSGIKQGGFLRKVIRHIKVRALPKNKPSHFTLDIRELNLKQSKRVKHIEFPEGVTPLTPENEVVVVIAKR